MARGSVRVEGLRELEKALAELPKSTGRNVLRRVLTARAQPMAATMAALAPDDPATSSNDLKNSIRVSTKVHNSVGKAEFAAVMQGGGTQQEAVAALRGARRAAAGEGSFAEVFVGPEYGRNSAVGSKQEFGTVNHGPQPFARPAWDQHHGQILDGIAKDLGDEIKRAAQRLARRRARAAARG